MVETGTELLKLLGQVFPPRIGRLDQRDFSRAKPALDLFFACDCVPNVAEFFVMHQSVYAISRREIPRPVSDGVR